MALDSCRGEDCWSVSCRDTDLAPPSQALHYVVPALAVAPLAEPAARAFRQVCPPPSYCSPYRVSYGSLNSASIPPGLCVRRSASAGRGTGGRNRRRACGAGPPDARLRSNSSSCDVFSLQPLCYCWASRTKHMPLHSQYRCHAI